MDNHYHLVLQIGEPGLSDGMRLLNGRFARGANVLRGSTNHVFGERFWAAEIDSDAYLYEVCRYVVLNPVRAGLCDQPDSWNWSSHRAAMGLDHPEPFLALGDFHSFFGRDPKTAIETYSRFVREGHDPMPVIG